MATLRDLLLPSVRREGDGLVPDQAVAKLSSWLKTLVVTYSKLGVPPSVPISQAYSDFLREEWAIEREQNPVGTVYATWAWEDTFDDALLSRLYTDMGKTKEEVVNFGNLLSHPFLIQRYGRMNLSVPGTDRTKSHNFFDWTANAFWFAYRTLSAFVYALMKAMLDAGMPVKTAYSLLIHPWLGPAESARLNEAIILMAGQAWMGMKIKGLFTDEEEAIIRRQDEAAKKRAEADYAAYARRQQELKQEIATLEQWHATLQAAKAPLEIVKKTTEAAAGIAGKPEEFLAAVKWVGIGAAALGIGYLIYKVAG